jgi:exonuclease III
VKVATFNINNINKRLDNLLACREILKIVKLEIVQ